MKLIVSGRHSLLPAMLAIAIVSPAFAGGVTVSRINTANGQLEAQVSGEMSHAPVHLAEIARHPLQLVDACGDIYTVKDGLYGEKELSGPLQPARALGTVRLIAPTRDGGVGVGRDGAPYEIDLDDESRRRQGSAYEAAIRIDSRIKLDNTRLFIPGVSGLPFFAFMNDGALLGIRRFDAGNEEARFVAPKNGWKDVQHAVTHRVNTGRDIVPALFTIDAGGSLALHVPVKDGEGYFTSVETKAVGASFKGTRALLAGETAPRENTLYRWTDGGDLYRVSVEKGAEQRIGNAGGFKGDLLMRAGDDLYLVSHSGSFTACPAEKAAPVAAAPKGKPGIVAAAEELKAMEKVFYTAVRAQQKKEYPGDIWEKSAGEIAAVLSPRLDDIERFEQTLATPVREKVTNFVAQYGDQNVANAKLREHTDSDVFLEGALNSLQNRLEEWDKYRRKMAADIASNGELYFQLAQAVGGNTAQAAAHFSKAKPYGDWALRFDPQNETAKRIAAMAEKNAELAKAAEAAAIASAIWPADDGDIDFDRNDMKKKMLVHFQKHRDDGDGSRGARYFAIRLSSGWVPGLTNWLGHILEWRIGGYIASTIPGDPAHALVTPIQIGTQTNSKTSPFENRYFRSDSYRIPIDRVPADDKAALQESLKLISK